MKDKLIELLPMHAYLQLRWHDFRLNKKNSFKKIQQLRQTDKENSGGYLPFDKAQAIFVHIPKCAGISLNKALFNSIGGGHTTLDQYINVFPPAVLMSYFKFTFVRNPWDRVVSAYTFLEKGGLNKWDKSFYEKELQHYNSFESFVRGWLKTENLMKHHHFRPQNHYIIDKYNKISVDYIGYFELIEEDYAFIAQKIGINKSLKKQNAVNRVDYKEFYNEETRGIVADVYSKDIELLNYNFEGIIEPRRKITL